MSVHGPRSLVGRGPRRVRHRVRQRHVSVCCVIEWTVQPDGHHEKPCETVAKTTMEIAGEGEGAASVEEVSGSPPRPTTQAAPASSHNGRNHPGRCAHDPVHSPYRHPALSLLRRRHDVDGKDRWLGPPASHGRRPRRPAHGRRRHPLPAPRVDAVESGCLLPDRTSPRRRCLRSAAFLLRLGDEPHDAPVHRRPAGPHVPGGHRDLR